MYERIQSVNVQRIHNLQVIMINTINTIPNNTKYVKRNYVGFKTKLD